MKSIKIFAKKGEKKNDNQIVKDTKSSQKSKTKVG